MICDFFGGFQKNEYSFGYEDFVDIFGGFTKLGYIGSFLCNLGSFLKDRVQNRRYFLKFLIFILG